MVSIVMIYLNESKYIREAIESVFAQTYGSWELLLVDDGSEDGSAGIARGYAEAEPGRVRYLEHAGHANLGMSASRNVGILEARGDLVALLDADDVWLPEKLERQVEILRRNPDAMMTYDETRHWYHWGEGQGVGGLERLRKLGLPPGTLVQPPRLIPLFLVGIAETPGTCSVLIRREAFDRIGGFVESFRGMYEDQVFFFKACLDLPVYVAGGVTALYRQHPESSCHVAARTGLYDPRGGGPAGKIFIDWFASYVARRIAADGPESGRPLAEIEEHIRRYVRRDAPDSWPVAMARWVIRRSLPLRLRSAIRARLGRTIR